MDESRNDTLLDRVSSFFPRFYSDTYQEEGRAGTDVEQIATMTKRTHIHRRRSRTEENNEFF